MRLILHTLVLVLILSTPAWAQLDSKVADRLWDSTKILEALVGAPDGGIPRDLLEKAECVAVIPSVKNLAFGFGARYGRGVAACRKDQGKGAWGPPSMLSLGGGSFGFQFGGQGIDVVMLFMTPDSMGYLLRDKVSLGGAVSAAAGPKGRSASAETSASFTAEILTYSRSRGLFAGISLNGAVIRPDSDANESLYGREIEARELLEQGNVTIPDPARRFVETLGSVAGVASGG